MNGTNLNTKNAGFFVAETYVNVPNRRTAFNYPIFMILNRNKYITCRPKYTGAVHPSAYDIFGGMK